MNAGATASTRIRLPIGKSMLAVEALKVMEDRRKITAVIVVDDDPTILAGVKCSCRSTCGAPR